jgi:4-hydroxybenzoate polyprenyltransferase
MGVGVAMIVLGVGGVVVVGFALRRRLPGPVVFVLLSGFSVALAAGALAVQDHTTTTDWVVALVAMGLLGPAHVRFLLGAFGRGARPGTAATEPV